MSECSLKKGKVHQFLRTPYQEKPGKGHHKSEISSTTRNKIINIGVSVLHDKSYLLIIFTIFVFTHNIYFQGGKISLESILRVVSFDQTFDQNLIPLGVSLCVTQLHKLGIRLLQVKKLG